MRQRGQVFKTKTGWSFRYYDHAGQRRQRGGFATRTEATTVLTEELKKVRLGGTYQPKLTLNELVARYLDQYDAAPSSRENLKYFLGMSQKAFGDELISQMDAHRIAAWRAKLGSDHQKEHATRALRQVLAAALRWGWIERNPAAAFKNESSRPADFSPFESWTQIDQVVAELDAVGAALVITAAGTGLRPEELFALRWTDVDTFARTILVTRAYAKGRMKEYTKTAGSRRTVPMRSRVGEAIEYLHYHATSTLGSDELTKAQRSSPLVFPSDRGGPIQIDNWRQRDWKHALISAGLEHRRIYDLRHTYATWSLAAGVNIFQLAKRMGTSVAQINRVYGHLLADADDAERELLDAYDQETTTTVVSEGPTTEDIQALQDAEEKWYSDDLIRGMGMEPGP